MLGESASPVWRWMAGMFPEWKPLLAGVRSAAGAIHLDPGDGVALGTQGSAIDWWLRFLIDPAVPDLRLAFAGSQFMSRHPAPTAARSLFSAAVDSNPVVFGNLLQQDEETQARMCYALALFTEFRRAPIRQSRLLTLTSGSGAQSILDLATAAEVADIIRMRDSATRIFLPSVPKGPVTSGPVFEGSQDLAADADLIISDTLVEFKATRGSRPRADGTRPVRFERTDLYQLIGYLLLDYSDNYKIRNIMFYAIRYEHHTTWPVTELLDIAAGRPLDLAETREAFKTILRTQIPAYLSAK